MARGGLPPAVEDLIGAGAVLSAFAPDRSSPGARAPDAGLRARGFEDDVRLAAELDVSDAVPVLVDGAFVRRKPGTASGWNE